MKPETNSQRSATISRHHRLILLFVPLLALLLAGCIGAGVTSKKVVASRNYLFNESGFSTISDRQNHGWDTLPPVANGKVQLDSRHHWCGLLVFVVIPVPIELPVCRERQFVTFKDSKPVAMTIERRDTSGYFCGPGVYLAIKGFGNGAKPRFCARFR